MNNIIIELSAEDRARLAHISVNLDRLIDALERGATQEAPTANTPDPIKAKPAEV